MQNNKYFPLSAFVILLFILYYAVTIYFLPELEKGAFDVASSIWFIFSPLYLLAKRLWLINRLNTWVMMIYDIFFCIVVQGSLIYTAMVSTPELSSRVYAVLILCILIWIAIFKTRKETDEEAEGTDQ